MGTAKICFIYVSHMFVLYNIYIYFLYTYLYIYAVYIYIERDVIYVLKVWIDYVLPESFWMF